MMEFNPRLIRNIDDVLPAIKDKPEFLVMDKGDYTVIDYVYQNDETFNCPVSLECRGIKFNKAGDIIARPYHKFFNYRENEQSKEPNVDFSQRHRLADKLDGSMVHSILIDGLVRLHTRKGYSDVAQKATKLLFEKYERIVGLMAAGMRQGLTYIFEYVGPNNKIVLDYAEEKLVLTGIRRMVTGYYEQYSTVIQTATEWSVDHAQLYPFSLTPGGKDDSINSIKGMKELEGVVVVFNSGARLKIKADDYVLRHRSKEKLSNPGDVIKMILNNEIDDLMPMLDKETQNKLKNYVRSFWTRINEVSRSHRASYKRSMYKLTKKELAMYMDKGLGTNPNSKFVYFKTHDRVADYLQNGSLDYANVDSLIENSISDLFIDRLKQKLNNKERTAEFCERYLIPMYKGSFFDN